MLGRFWDKVDGHKTTIGLALLQIANLITNPAYQTLALYVGYFLSGTGLAHKAVKIVS